MPDTPITPILGEITEMQAAFKQPSCNSKLPFVSYPSVGTPPVLSFNVPQNTTFVTYGHFMKYFPPTHFKPFTLKPPENNYFNTIRNMNAQQAKDLFLTGIKETTWLVPRDVAGAAAGFKAPTEESKPTVTAAAGFKAPTEESKPTVTAAVTSRSGMDEKIARIYDPYIVMTDRKAEYAANNLRSYDVTRLNGLGQVTKYIAEPPQATPRIIILEEYTTAAYIGNYGAGRIVKTFSLYPGERTTLSVRTYKDRVSTVEHSKNVLDSFSEASATALDTLMQQEQGDISSTSDTAAGGGSSFTTSTDSRNSSRSGGIKGSLNLGFFSIGGGYGKSMTEASTSAGGMSSTNSYNHTASRMSNMNTLSSALNKHVQQSNAVRQVEVNTSTVDTTRTGEESVTVRELQNVNLNNVLNITYRQLQQEYTVITYLSNVRFAYTNGYPESYTVVDLSDLENMLKDIIDVPPTDPDRINDVMCALLSPYCNVLDYQSVTHQFVQKFPLTNTDCLNLGCTPPVNENLFRIPPGFHMNYMDGVVDLEVPGVILKVQKQTLQTSSLIADALLGRGDALDCFNQNAQNAANISAYTAAMQSMQRLTESVQTTANNQLFADQQLDLGTKQVDLAEKQVALAEKKMEVMDQQMDVVNDITDPLEKATHYKKVFGDCCDVPQSCCGGGCGCDCADHTDEAPGS